MSTHKFMTGKKLKATHMLVKCPPTGLYPQLFLSYFVRIYLLVKLHFSHELLHLYTSLEEPSRSVTKVSDCGIIPIIYFKFLSRLGTRLGKQFVLLKT